MISAVDFAGNRTSASIGAIHVHRDTTPPVVEAQLVGNALFWKADDRLSQHLRGALLGPGRTEFRDFAHSGVRSFLPGAPHPTWLLVADSSGNTARVRLSGVTASGQQPPRLPALRSPARATLTWVR